MKRVLFALALLGCLFVVALQFQAREPVVEGPGGFDLVAFFSGESSSEGSIRTLLVRSQSFTARFHGAREGEAFRLEERFSFPEGERLQVWTLTQVPGGYRGTVETQGADGRLAPPAPVVGIVDATGVALDYRGIAPGGDRELHFRHHMRMRDDGRVANHVVVSAYGLPLATSSVTFTGAALPSPSAGR